MMSTVILLSCFLFIKLPQESLNVDRWSVISSFWDNYFSGKYVYFATSHMGNYPGPMPFYYVLALPFYLMGELGYYSLMGIPVFFLVMKFSKIPDFRQTLIFIGLFSSFFFWWEIICRSNIFLNATLVLFSILFLFYSEERKFRGFLLWNGLVIGLLLSTRNVFVIPYIVAFLYLLKFNKINFWQIVQIGVIAGCIFVLTFIPFIINHFRDFMQMNPFVIQSDYLMPKYLSITCILLTFPVYFLLKSRKDVIFYGNLMLFFTILVYFIYQTTRHGLSKAILDSKIDVSYFILGMPFLLFYLIQNLENESGTDQITGKE